MPQLPSWELTKEIADKLPGKDPQGDGEQDDKCPACGTPYDDMDKDQKPR